MSRLQDFLDKIPERLLPKTKKLVELIQSTGGMVIAMSGGVDSTFLAVAAKAAIGSRAIAVTGISSALPQRELKVARKVAALFDIWHLEVKTLEQDNPGYRANGPDRCYHCKTELFKRLWRLAKEIEIPVVADGSNSDDLNDYRPGLRAAAEQNVISPLAEAGFTKADIRAAAQAVGLSNHAKPASPCLSSRFPYGVEISAEGLKSVETAEDAILKLGFTDCRVRKYDNLAKIELPTAELAATRISSVRDSLVAAVKSAGFEQVEIDADGLRSGNLNKNILTHS